MVVRAIGDLTLVWTIVGDFCSFSAMTPGESVTLCACFLISENEGHNSVSSSGWWGGVSELVYMICLGRCQACSEHCEKPWSVPALSSQLPPSFGYLLIPHSDHANLVRLPVSLVQVLGKLVLLKWPKLIWRWEGALPLLKRCQLVVASSIWLRPFCKMEVRPYGNLNWVPKSVRTKA